MNDLTFEDYLKEDNLKMYAQIKRVRELHRRVNEKGYECGDGCCWSPDVDECEECMQSWPCDTIKALDGEQA